MVGAGNMYNPAAILAIQIYASPDTACPYGEFKILESYYGNPTKDTIKIWFNNGTTCSDFLPQNIGDSLFLLIDQDYGMAGVNPLICTLDTVNDYTTFSHCAHGTAILKNDTLYSSAFYGSSLFEPATRYLPDTVGNCNSICLKEIQASQNPAYGLVLFTKKYVFCYGETQTLSVKGGIEYKWFNGDTTPQTTFNVDTGQIYWAKITDSLNCVVYDTFRPYVSALKITKSPNDTVICLGDCLNLSYELIDFENPTDQVNYSFNGGVGSGITNQGLVNINICPTQSNWHTMRLMTEFASLCYNDDSVYVEVVPNLVTSLNFTDTTICPNDSILIAASGNYSFLWSTGDTSSSIWVAPAADSTFSVEVSDSLGCAETITTIVRVSLTNVTFSLTNTDTICQGDAVFLGVDSVQGNTYLWSTGNITHEITLSPGIITQDTTFELTITNAIGCTSSYEFDVVVRTHPSVILNNIALCEDALGYSISIPTGLAQPAGGLFIESIYGVSFVNNQIQISSLAVAGSFKYYYNFTDAFGCTNIDSANLTIAPSLATPVLSNNGDTIFINATTCDSILWAVGSQTFTTTQNYIVIDTVVDIKALCYDGYCRSPLSNVFSHMPVGLEDAFNGTLKIYPTVFNKHLTVEPEEALEWQLINVDGKEILSGFAENKTEIATSQIASGMYFFVVQTDENIQSIKLIKP